MHLSAPFSWFKEVNENERSPSVTWDSPLLAKMVLWKESGWRPWPLSLSGKSEALTCVFCLWRNAVCWVRASSLCHAIASPGDLLTPAPGKWPNDLVWISSWFSHFRLEVLVSNTLPRGWGSQVRPCRRRPLWVGPRIVAWNPRHLNYMLSMDLSPRRWQPCWLVLSTRWAHGTKKDAVGAIRPWRVNRIQFLSWGPYISF